MRAGTWTWLLALSACAAPGIHLAGTSVRTLGPGLSFEAPTGLELSVTAGPDFVVYRAYDPDRDWGFGVYEGGYPGSFRGAGATFEMDVLLRRPVLWSRWQDTDGVAHEEAFVWRDGHALHVFANAASDAELDELHGTMRTLEDADVYRTLPPCPLDGASPSRTEEPLVGDAATLAYAAALDLRFAAPERAAWQRLVIRPDAERVFRAIALTVDSTPAGRVYGLAGLYATGADDADRLACALRPGDGESIALPSTCPTRSIPAHAVHASPITPRWERHWNGFAAHRATSHAPLTVRGGTLTIDLAVPAPSFALRPVAVEPFAAPGSVHLSQDHDRWVDAVGDLCWLDGGGGTHCLLHEVPEAIRGPTALAFRDSGGCALSSMGQRTCFAAVSSRTRAEARRCFVEIPDVEIRTYDDGPWARIFRCAWTVCGIHASTGELRRFTNQAADRFSSEPVDVRDAKTTDGTFAGDRHGGLWDVANEERIAAFEVGIERVVELGERGDRALVRLRDGRVAVSAASAAWLETSGLELEAGPDGWHFVAEWTGVALSGGPSLVCWDHAGLGRCVTDVDVPASHTYQARVVDVPLADPTVVDDLVCSRETGGRVACIAITVVDGAPMSPIPLAIDLSRW